MNNTSSTAPSLPVLLLVLFIGLKLTGSIDWSWWWVLSPLWIPLSIAFIIGFVIGINKHLNK